MFRKLTTAVSTMALAAAIATSTPRPAEAFFVLPIVAAAAMFGAFGLGAAGGSFFSNDYTRGNLKCKMGSTYDQTTGRFDGGWAKVCRP
jgi:hypothetical protein